MQFQGFNKKSIEFLKNLKQNNSKIWFEANRSEWEEHIKNRSVDFVNEMGQHLQILVPTIHFKPKVAGSLFRIYRDIRFSKDKTPMKSKIGLLFWQGRGHRMQSSSFYMHFDEDEYFIATGIRNFKPPLLHTYRQYIKDEKNRTKLHNIIEKLIAKGYLIGEPKFKRMPRDFDKNEKHSYLALFGAIFAYQQFPIDETFLSQNLIHKAFKIYQDMQSLQTWLYQMTLTQPTD